jgi:hypothetical protein
MEPNNTASEIGILIVGWGSISLFLSAGTGVDVQNVLLSDQHSVSRPPYNFAYVHTVANDYHE